MTLGRVGQPRVGRAEVLVVLLVVRFGAFVFHVSVGLCLGPVSVALGPVVVWRGGVSQVLRAACSFLVCGVVVCVWVVCSCRVLRSVWCSCGAGGLLITKFRFQKRSSHANGSDCCGAAQHDGSDRSPRSGCLQHLTRRSGASIPLRDPAILSSDRARSSRSNSGSGHVLVVESDARLRAHQRLTARASGRLSARLRATERMVAQLA